MKKEPKIKDKTNFGKPANIIEFMKGGKKKDSSGKKRDIVYNAIKFFYFETPNDNASSLIYVTKAAITDIEGRWKIIYFCNFFPFFLLSFVHCRGLVSFSAPPLFVSRNIYSVRSGAQTHFRMLKRLCYALKKSLGDERECKCWLFIAKILFISL